MVYTFRLNVTSWIGVFIPAAPQYSAWIITFSILYRHTVRGHATFIRKLGFRHSPVDVCAHFHTRLYTSTHVRILPHVHACALSTLNDKRMTKVINSIVYLVNTIPTLMQGTKIFDHHSSVSDIHHINSCGMSNYGQQHIWHSSIDVVDVSVCVHLYIIILSIVLFLAEWFTLLSQAAYCCNHTSFE